MSRSRGWCFTLNNFSEAERDEILAIECQYLIVGRERGAEGTPHLQGFVQFENKKSLSQVKALNQRAHWEETKGSIDQNITYCSKEGDFEERGTRPMSQKRKGEANIERYDRARKLAKEGKLDEVDADIHVRNYGNLKKIQAEHQCVLPVLPGELHEKNWWIWGPAGVGKSIEVQRRFPGAYAKDLNKWWDGYDGQEVVKIEEMDHYHKNLAREFKIWGDRFAFPAETKGGSMMVRPKRVIVLSNESINEVWEDEVTRAAMHRRYKEILKTELTPEDLEFIKEMNGGEAVPSEAGAEESKEVEWDGRLPLHELIARYGSN